MSEPFPLFCKKCVTFLWEMCMEYSTTISKLQIQSSNIIKEYIMTNRQDDLRLENSVKKQEPLGTYFVIFKQRAGVLYWI